MVNKFAIATVAEQSSDFRRVLWTGTYTQLVTMTIPPGGEIGEEVHEDEGGGRRGRGVWYAPAAALR